MSWTRVFVLAVLTTLLILTISSVLDGAAVRDDTKAKQPKGPARRVFMPGSDASNFFKRRGRRSAWYYREADDEQRVRSTANIQRRRYNEEQRSEYENYLEEVRDEQLERTRETNEQWRRYHYDGLYPRYFWYY